MKLKWIATCTSALFLVGLFASSLASAQGLPLKGGVINACVKTKGKKKQRGTLRIVKSAKQCKRKKGERPVTWNLQGPAGAVGTQGSQGTAGEPGATGAQGASGAAGAPGQRGDAGSAAAVEGQLKEVITRQTKEIEKLSGGLINLNAELGALEGTLETVEQTVKGTVNGLLSVEGGLGGLEGVTKGLEAGAKTLTETVGKQCTSLTTVANQGNGLLGVVGKVLGVPLIGTALGPLELPKETKFPVC